MIFLVDISMTIAANNPYFLHSSLSFASYSISSKISSRYGHLIPLFHCSPPKLLKSKNSDPRYQKRLKR